MPMIISVEIVHICSVYYTGEGSSNNDITEHPHDDTSNDDAFLQTKYVVPFIMQSVNMKNDVVRGKVQWLSPTNRE